MRMARNTAVAPSSTEGAVQHEIGGEPANYLTTFFGEMGAAQKIAAVHANRAK